MTISVRSLRIGLALAAGTLFTCAAPAPAQEWGVKLGASSSNVFFEYGPVVPDIPGIPRVETGQGNRARRGVTVGAFARLPLGGRFSLQPEALYVQKGFEVTQPTLHVDYLELPLLLRLDFPALGGRVQPFALAGPAVAVQLVRRYSGGPCLDDQPTCEFDVDIPVLHDEDPMDVGVAVGGGLAVRAGPGRVVLEARHTRGLRDVEHGGFQEEKSLNHANTVTLGYALPLRLPFRK